MSCKYVMTDTEASNALEEAIDDPAKPEIPDGIGTARNGDLFVYKTGAVRSKDADNVRYDLISPIAMAAIARAALNIVEVAEVFPDTTWEAIGACRRSSQLFLAGMGDERLWEAAYYALLAAHHEKSEIIGDYDTFIGNINAMRSADADDIYYGEALIPPLGLRAVAEAYHEGVIKYKAFNCELGFPFDNLYNHAQEHYTKWCSGDRSEPHLGHGAWNYCLMIHSLYMWPGLNPESKFRRTGCLAPTVNDDIPKQNGWRLYFGDLTHQ
jgi:hypothetical protein